MAGNSNSKGNCRYFPPIFPIHLKTRHRGDGAKVQADFTNTLYPVPFSYVIDPSTHKNDVLLFTGSSGQCGRSHTSTLGTFFMPSWGNSYDNNVDCSWEVNLLASEAGEMARIKVDFLSFDIDTARSEEGCSSDGLDIR